MKIVLNGIVFSIFACCHIIDVFGKSRRLVLYPEMISQIQDYLEVNIRYNSKRLKKLT